MIKFLEKHDIIENLEVLSDVYKSALKTTDEDVNFFVERIKSSIELDNSTVIIVVLENEKIVGFIYGCKFEKENWWAKQIDSRLPNDVDWYDNSFELIEFMVKPEFQNKGYGKKLIEFLKDNTNYSRYLLSTLKFNNEKVRAFYENNNFKIIIDDFEYKNFEYGTTVILCLNK